MQHAVHGWRRVCTSRWATVRGAWATVRGAKHSNGFHSRSHPGQFHVFNCPLVPHGDLLYVLYLLYLLTLATTYYLLLTY